MIPRVGRALSKCLNYVLGLVKLYSFQNYYRTADAPSCIHQTMLAVYNILDHVCVIENINSAHIMENAYELQGM